MPGAVTYEGLELEWIIVGPPGPNRGRMVGNISDPGYVEIA